MMQSPLCKECPEDGYCKIPCPESQEQIPIDPKDRLKDKEYVAKGVPLLSYKDSRKTKYNDLKELNFD